MFQPGQIWAYPTDTSFGLGVRADDFDTLQRMYDLKQRGAGKYFSLMVRDGAMLCEFAETGDLEIPDLDAWFLEKPRTIILKPTGQLPKTKFWPEDKVAFRICTIPEIAAHIDYPVTATSANLSGEQNMYSIKKLQEIFGDEVMYCELFPKLPVIPPSEIWDFTTPEPLQLR